MTLFSKEINLKSVGNALLSALVLLFASCTEVDDNLGVGIIPPGQNFEVQTATLGEGIESYLTYTDSISTGRLDYAYFGKMTDKTYGAKTKASALVQFAYAVHSDTIAYENRESMPDSLAIVLGMKTVGGDTTKVQTFDIYRVRKLLERDSTYYSGTDITEYIDERPMFKCTYSGRPNGADAFDTLSLKVADSQLAEAFINELWSVDTALYSNDTLFMELFNGLCITPAGESPDDAAIYGMNLQWDASDGPQSYLILYGHYDNEDEELDEDQIMRAFSITNSTTYSNQRAVTAVEHDYSAMVDGALINVNVPADQPLENPTSEGYIQGFMGVTTTLEFGEEFVESLRALCPEGQGIFINQAKMYVNLASDDYTLYDIAPARVGTYLNYATLEAVPDYAYLYETTYEVELAYGGYLNRTFGYYTMDLSLYLQELLHDEEGKVSRRITLGMDAYDYVKEAMVKLATSGEQKSVKFDITYTLIGK